MAYTDKTQIEAYTGTTIPATLTTQLTAWITAAEEWINSYVGFKFEDGLVATKKTYSGNGQKTLFVQPFYSPTSITILDEDGNQEETLTSDDYILYPLNSTGKNRIELKSDASIFGKTKRIEINAMHAFGSTVPQQVQLVATKLVAKILNENFKGGEITSQSLGDYSVSFAKVDEEADVLGIKQILDFYRNIEI